MNAERTSYIDTPARYGRITRFLHWSMAVLFAWQFTSALLRVFAEDSPIEQFFWGTHASTGTLLMALAVARGAWGLINFSRRPAAGKGMLGLLAAGGHLALYLLMMAVPALALLRSYGRGRGLSVFGVQLFEARGTEISTLMTPGNALHGVLGWTLLALACAHIFMALVHRYVWKDQVLARMAGRPSLS